MRIQHNISAMNSYRNFSANTSNLSKNLEKLSSGYKINRAGDDAAGLAISEKMRAQITGIEGATKNSKDGISLIQTAEGALTEVHDMLNRMTTLAEQSANGTYQDELDREQLQKEVTALKEEIDRIADSTNFNGLKLLDGSLAESTTAVNNETQLMTVKGSITGGAATADFADATGDSYAVTLGAVNNTNFDAIKIGFTDAKGKDYELTLVSNVANTSGTTNADLINALNGDSQLLNLTSASSDNPQEALDAFRNTFAISGDTTGNDGAVTFTVKDSAIGAKLTSISANTTGASPNASVTAMAARGLTKTEGLAAGYELSIDTKPTAGDTISIGDKVYEFVGAAGDAVSTAGATAVVIGADTDTVTIGSSSYTSTEITGAGNMAKASTMNNLFSRLKEDGYSVSLNLDGNADGTKNDWAIRFTDLEQISEAQTGAAVTVSSSNLAVQDQEASKQSTTLTLSGATAADNGTVTISYTDAEGKNRSKDVSFTTATAAADNAEAIAKALKDDADLSALFEIDSDGADVTLVARSTDNSVGQLGSITVTSDNATPGNRPSSTSVTTAGVNDGKAIELKDGSKNVSAGDTVTVNGKTYEFAASGSSKIGEGNVRVLVGSDGPDSMKNLSKAMTDNGILNSYDAASGKVVLRDTDNALEQTSGGLSLQIGDTADAFNKLTVSVNDMHASAIGVGDVDISTQEGASAALDKIKQAINNVSDTRGTLGALQNRLDHTINNLGVQRENIQNAESLIRDTDVAEEMMTYTKNNILNQSAQAMLAQANQLPQGVLQLLG